MLRPRLNQRSPLHRLIAATRCIRSHRQTMSPYSKRKIFAPFSKRRCSPKLVIRLLTTSCRTQVISSDINLALCTIFTLEARWFIDSPSGLERLTSIAADICHAQFACVAMRTDNGDWALSTAMTVPQPCTYFESPVPLRSSTAVVDPLCRAVLQHTLNVQEPVFIEDVTQEPRFATEAYVSEECV